VGHSTQYRSAANAPSPDHDPDHLQESCKGAAKLVADCAASRDVDLCSVDPGFDVDLYVSTDVRTMTEIWMGYTTIARAKEQAKLFVSGNKELETSMRSWFSLSRFAKVGKLVA
jgi:hypothetical protein